MKRKGAGAGIDEGRAAFPPRLAAFYTRSPYARRQPAVWNDGTAPLVGEEELDPRAVDLATGSEVIFVPPCLFFMENR